MTPTQCNWLHFYMVEMHMDLSMEQDGWVTSVSENSHSTEEGIFLLAVTVSISVDKISECKIQQRFHFFVTSSTELFLYLFHRCRDTFYDFHHRPHHPICHLISWKHNQPGPLHLGHHFSSLCKKLEIKWVWWHSLWRIQEVFWMENLPWLPSNQTQVPSRSWSDSPIHPRKYVSPLTNITIHRKPKGSIILLPKKCLPSSRILTHRVPGHTHSQLHCQWKQYFHLQPHRQPGQHFLWLQLGKVHNNLHHKTCNHGHRLRKINSHKCSVHVK